MTKYQAVLTSLDTPLILQMILCSLTTMMQPIMMVLKAPICQPIH